MRRLSVVIILSVAALAAACSFVVDTSDLATGHAGDEAGAATDPDGAVSTPGPDAAAQTTPAPETGADAADDRAYRDAVLLDVPFAYLRLGEKAGPVAKDERGVADGTYIGQAAFAQPPLVRGLDRSLGLDGGGVVGIAAPFDLTGTNPFTIELWLSVPVKDAAYRYPVMKEKSGTERRGFAIFLHGQDLALERYAGGGGVFVTQSGFAEGVVHHVVGTYGNGALRLYVDGLLVGTTPDTRRITLGVDDPLVIGGNSTGSGTENRFLGTLDEVAIYDKVLGEDRIHVHYDLGRRP